MNVEHTIVEDDIRKTSSAEGPSLSEVGVKSQRWDIAAICLTMAYVIIFTVLSICRHEGLRTQMNDLGNMTQAIWRASEGDLSMRVTNDPDGEIRSRLGVHANFFFYILAIPFALIPPLASQMEWFLLFGTSFASGIAGLGIYFFGRQHLAFLDSAQSQIANRKFKMALLLALAYWLNPMVHDANLYDFHVITFATAFIVWMLWAWSAGWTKTGWVLFTLALFCKEDVPFVLFMLGLGELSTKNRLRGLAMMSISSLYLLFLFGLFIPLVNLGEPLPKVATSRLGWLGTTPVECVMTLVTQPLMVLNHVLAYDHIRLPVFLYLIAGVFAIFGGWRILIGVVPPVAVALLAGNDWMCRITGTYYWITAVALICLACVLSVKANSMMPRFQRAGIGYVTGVSLIACLFFSQTPLGLFSKQTDFHIHSEYREALGEVKALIPREASISAQNNIAAHFAKRATVAVFASQLEAADFVLFHLRYPGGPDPVLFPSYTTRHLLRATPEEHIERIRTFLESDEWTMVYSREGFFVFKRSEKKGGGKVTKKQMQYEMERYRESLMDEAPGRFKQAVYKILGYHGYNL